MIPQSGIPILSQILQLWLDQPKQTLSLELKVPKVVVLQGPEGGGLLLLLGGRGVAAQGAAEAPRELHLVAVGAGGRDVFQLLYGAARGAAVADHGYYVDLEVEIRDLN